MRNRVIVKGNVALAFNINTGYVGYFDKEDIEIAYKASVTPANIQGNSYFQRLDYPTCGKGSIYKNIYKSHISEAQKENFDKSSYVHHISEVKYDNRFCNLIQTTKEGHGTLHKHFIYKYENLIDTSIDYNELSAIMECREGFDFTLNTIYNPLRDMSYCQDLFFGYLAGILSEEEFLIKRLQYLAQNPLLIYYFGLENLCDKYSLDYSIFEFDDCGYMCTKWGTRLRDVVEKTLNPNFVFNVSSSPCIKNITDTEELLHFYYYYLRSCNKSSDLQGLLYKDSKYSESTKSPDNLIELKRSYSNLLRRTESFEKLLLIVAERTRQIQLTRSNELDCIGDIDKRLLDLEKTIVKTNSTNTDRYDVQLKLEELKKTGYFKYNQTLEDNEFFQDVKEEVHRLSGHLLIKENDYETDYTDEEFISTHDDDFLSDL